MCVCVYIHTLSYNVKKKVHIHSCKYEKKRNIISLHFSVNCNMKI